MKIKPPGTDLPGITPMEQFSPEGAIGDTPAAPDKAVGTMATSEVITNDDGFTQALEHITDQLETGLITDREQAIDRVVDQVLDEQFGPDFIQLPAYGEMRTEITQVLSMDPLIRQILNRFFPET